jgi:hypothetical protein
MNKKGEGSSILRMEVIYIILVIVLYAFFFYFVTRAGSGASFAEQKYAKKTALLIDQAKPGTTLTLDLSELFDIAIRNKMDLTQILSIDTNTNAVIVKVQEDGRGYGFSFFSEEPIKWGLDPKSEKLTLEAG